MRRIGILLLVLVLFLVTTVTAQDDGGVQIAVSGADGNIYIYDVASEALTPVTSDATFEQPVRFYDWPTWSSDGQLAYFGTNLDPENFFGLGIYIMQQGQEPKGVFSAADEIFTYAYWSPGDCPDGNCRDLAVLYSSEVGLATRMIRSGETFDVTEIAEGGPFYWDWSPDGSEMFWARYGTTLEIYDVASDAVVQVFDETQGRAQSVDWSPVDDRLLAATLAANGTTTLTLIDGEERLDLASGIEGVIAFEWSPDGSMAGMLIRNTGEFFLIDTQTGEQIAMPAREVLAFFWAPDSNQIGYIGIDRGGSPGAKRIQQGVPALLWNVYSVDVDSNTSYASFQPSEDMIYYLNFFDQFARSHRLWSSDSRYIVYGETTPNGEQVSIIDVQGNGVAQVVSEGGIGIFNW